MTSLVHSGQGASVPVTSGWQPIATAPKDGTRLDLWVKFAETGERRVPDAYWNYALKDWQLGQRNASDYMIRPTIEFWMPLPAPPEQSA